MELEFECWGLTVRAQGRILRHSPPGQGLQGYGIQFLGLTADQKHHVRSLVQTLRAHQVPLREETIVLDSGAEAPPEAGQPAANRPVSG